MKKLNPTEISKYFFVFKNSIKETLIFKLDFILMASAGLIQLLVQYYILTNIFKMETRVGLFSFKTALTYLVLNCSINSILAYNVDVYLKYDIQYGKIINLLTKPINIPRYYLFKGLGIVASKFLTESFLLFCIGIIFFHPIVIPSPVNFVLFFLSFIFGVFIFMQIVLALGFLCFFIHDNSGLITAIFFIRMLFSGALFPLDFFPLWLQKTAGYLPFHLMINKPFKIFLGFESISDILKVFLFQLLWIIALHVIMKIIYALGIKKYHSVGG